MNTILDSHFTYKGTRNYVKMSVESIAARDEFISKNDEKNVLEKQNCFLCDSEKFHLINEVDRYGFYYPTGMCTQCGNVQQTKYYKESVLIDFYANFYRKIYGNSSSVQLFKSQKKYSGNKIFDFVAKYRNPKNVLEIGCGAGGILAVFKENGANVTGLDFDDDYLNEARNHDINVIKGSTEVLDIDQKFDVIILSHLLEHIVNPHDFLQDVKRFLSKDGLIYIEVPSINSVRDGAFHYDLLRYWQNAHTIHFTTKSLSLLCKSVGLENVFSTNFIESCWKVSEIKKIITKEDLLSNLEHTQSVLHETEKIRKSLHGRITNLKAKMLPILSNFGLDVFAIKSFLRNMKVKIKL